MTFSVIKNFERWDEARKISVQFWPQGEGDLRMQNPYWIAYRNLRLNNKKRYMASAGLSYQILDWLNVAGRVASTIPTASMKASCMQVLVRH